MPLFLNLAQKTRFSERNNRQIGRSNS